jgi:Tfp pilus assembly protein FimT
MRNEKGLTIAECLISMMLLAILLAAGMAFYFNAEQGFRWSVHKRIAVEMASAELESIKNSGYASLPEPAPAGNLWRGGVAVAVGNLSGQKDIYVYDIDADGGGTDYKQVRIVVSWHDPASRSVSLDTYIAP